MVWILVAAQAVDPTYAAAVEARTAGRTEEAIAAFEALARQRPADADVQLNLGLAYIAAHRYDAADRALEAALRLAPDYRDARLAYARSALFAGDPATARKRLAPLSATSAGDPEVQALARQIDGAPAAAAAPVTWRLDLAHARSELSNGLGHWSSTIVALSARHGRDTGVLSVDRTERFGREDVFIEALGARAFGPNRDAWIAVGGTPDADYRPEFSVRGGGSARIDAKGAWTTRLGADASWARYQVGDVRGLQPYAVLAWKERVSLTARAFLTVDELDDFRSGYAVRGDWSPRGDLRLYAGWADAPESSSGRTVTVRAASAGAAVDFSRALSLQLGFTHEMRDAYDRDEVAIALTTRF